MHEDGCKQCLIVFVLVLVAVQRAQLDIALQGFSAEFLRLCTNHQDDGHTCFIGCTGEWKILPQALH